MSFTRVVEDFVCEHCHAKVQGTGYTNHCPTCLWSKHVDIDPGDRAEKCGGMMEPVGVEGSSPTYRIVHVCQKCGAMRKVDAAKDDNAQVIIALARST